MSPEEFSSCSINKKLIGCITISTNAIAACWPMVLRKNNFNEIRRAMRHENQGLKSKRANAGENKIDKIERTEINVIFDWKCLKRYTAVEYAEVFSWDRFVLTVRKAIAKNRGGMACTIQRTHSKWQTRLQPLQLDQEIMELFCFLMHTRTSTNYIMGHKFFKISCGEEI